MEIRPLILTLALFLLVPANALADGGDINGTVTVDGQPANGMCVVVFDNWANGVAQATTDAAGAYHLYVADPGWYTVRFDDCGAGFTTRQYYGGADNADYAWPVEVISDGSTDNINGSLSSAGHVSGHVENSTETALQGACVHAEDQNGFVIAETATDVYGNYTLTGLVPGDAVIQFRGCGAGNYVLEYYDDAPTPNEATHVAVTAGETTSGINAALTAAGRFSGRVENANGEPLPSMCVSGWAGGAEVFTAVTDSNGGYVIREVPPAGTYELSAYDCYGDTYMNHQRNGQLAGAVNMVVNFTLPRPAHITGHVRDEVGTGLGSICVTATATDDGDKALAQTDKNGYYELNQLRPGSYDLSFNVGASDGEEEGCAANGDFGGATTTNVVVADGATLWDVDKTLRHPRTSDSPAQPPASGGSAPPEQAGASDTGGGSGQPATLERGSVKACVVPKLVGLRLAKAKKALASAGCRVGKVTKKRARKRVRKGRVVAQKTRRGASLPAGFKVALTVAK